MNKVFILTIFFFSIGFMHAQEKGKFYFSLNLNQDYRDDILLYIDSIKINDFRFRSSFLIGYSGDITALRGDWGASYENRYQQYFKFSYYTRMEHLLNINTSIPVYKQNLFYFNDDIRIRNYENLKHNNYVRNIFLIYFESVISSQLKLILGYRNWIKNYPNVLNPKNYLSHRPFMKLNFQLNTTTFLGVKTEYQWHKGVLYPNLIKQIYTGDFSGSRYLVEFFGNTIFFKIFLVDFTYRFEYDITSDINYQFSGNNEGEEETEDLLIEDPDFDYYKNQAAVTFLYKINSKMSFFSFIVLQNKNFNSWKIDTEGNTLRSDLLFYSSLILKYKILPDVRISLNYEYENRNSNLIKMIYHRNTIGLGFQYNF